MAKEITGHLKSQEEVNHLMAKLWVDHNKQHNIEINKTYFALTLPDITEEEKKRRCDYDRRLSMAVRIVEKGYPVSWANGITRISCDAIQKEYDKLQTEKKSIQIEKEEVIQNDLSTLKLKRLNPIKSFFSKAFNIFSFHRNKK